MSATFSNASDLRKALKDSGDLRCEDTYSFELFGQKGTSKVCSGSKRVDGTAEVFFLITCPSSTPCDQEHLLGSESTLHDPGGRKGLPPSYCYIKGPGDWAVGGATYQYGLRADCGIAERATAAIISATE